MQDSAVRSLVYGRDELGEFAPLWPPSWYSSFEDTVQGLQALTLLGALIALAAAAIGPEQPLVVRHEPTDADGRALRRAVEDRRGRYT